MSTDKEQYLHSRIDGTDRGRGCERPRRPQEREEPELSDEVMQAELDACTEAYFASDEWTLDLDAIDVESDLFAVDGWIDEMEPEVIERWQATLP